MQRNQYSKFYGKTSRQNLPRSSPRSVLMRGIARQMWQVRPLYPAYRPCGMTEGAIANFTRQGTAKTAKCGKLYRRCATKFKKLFLNFVRLIKYCVIFLFIVYYLYKDFSDTPVYAQG